MRTADVYLLGRLTGTLSEDDNGAFRFQYDAQYLQDFNNLFVRILIELI